MNLWLKIILQVYFVAPYILVVFLLMRSPAPEENFDSTDCINAWDRSDGAPVVTGYTYTTSAWDRDEGSLVVTGTMDVYPYYSGSSLVVGGSLTVDGTMEVFPYWSSTFGD